MHSRPLWTFFFLSILVGVGFYLRGDTDNYSLNQT